MGVKTVEERLDRLEKEWDVEKAVRLVMEGVSREIREAREETKRALEKAEMASAKAETASAKAVEKAVEASKKDAFANRLWIIGTILLALALCATLMHHETDRSWNMAMNAYQQPSAVIARADQARSDVEAMRTMKTAPQEGKLHSMAE